jgi:hypothetical protein
MLNLFNSGGRINLVSPQSHYLLVIFSLSQQLVLVLNDFLTLLGMFVITAAVV